MDLHVAPRTRAIRARWLLEEAGIEHQVVQLDQRALAPLEEPPILVDGPSRLAGSLPVLLFLAGHPACGALGHGPDEPSRGEVLQWLVFSEATLDPLVTAHLPGGRGADDARLRAGLARLEERLAGRAHLAAGRFTVADVSLASLLHLANHLGLLGGHPALVDYVRAHTGRPAVRRAMG